MKTDQVNTMDTMLAKLRLITAKHPRGVRHTLTGDRDCEEKPRDITPDELRRDAAACSEVSRRFTYIANQLEQQLQTEHT